MLRARVVPLTAERSAINSLLTRHYRRVVRPGTTFLYNNNPKWCSMAGSFKQWFPILSEFSSKKNLQCVILRQPDNVEQERIRKTAIQLW
jgi:hypothetical protein